MHVGIARGENVPGIPGACASAILRIWQEAHAPNINGVLSKLPLKLGQRRLIISHSHSRMGMLLLIHALYAMLLRKTLFCQTLTSMTNIRPSHLTYLWHCSDIIMTTMASQITNPTIVCSIVYSDADQRKHQRSASLAFVWGIHRSAVNSPHKGPVTRKMFPFDDVIMGRQWTHKNNLYQPYTWELHYELSMRPSTKVLSITRWSLTRCRKRLISNGHATRMTQLMCVVYGSCLLFQVGHNEAVCVTKNKQYHRRGQTPKNYVKSKYIYSSGHLFGTPRAETTHSPK